MNRYPEETLFVLGMGPGDLRWIPPATADRALEARTLFGDPRHLDLLPPAPGQDRFPLPPRLGDLPELVEAAPGPVGVLVSGDPGFYSLARRHLQALGITEIYGGGECTVENAAHYFSYRRDRVCGRMATLIWLAQA